MFRPILSKLATRTYTGLGQGIIPGPRPRPELYRDQEQDKPKNNLI